MRLIGLSALLFALFTSLAHSQGTLVGRVLLAAVTDVRNRPIVDLDSDSFVVHENGEQREVLSVRIADYPLVVLVDNASHAAADIDAIRSATARFVTRVGERAVAIVTMAGPPTVVADFETDREATLAAIAAIQIGGPVRRPFQGLQEATWLIQATESPFAAVVAVTVAPAETFEEEPRGLLSEFFDSRDILHIVTRAGRGSSPGQAAAITPDEVLRDVATRSGGRATTIYSSVSFQVALDQIADTLATEMLVEYLAPPGDGVGVDVRVGVSIPGTRVRGLGVWR